jgi:hypothetical protein
MQEAITFPALRGQLHENLVFAVSLAKNVLECKKAYALMAMLAALQGRIKCAKSALSPSAKALNYVLNADFPCETTKKGPISYVTASTFQANPKKKSIMP